jgi:poly(3-hydroxybutyrate) depolymerase
MFPQGGPSCTPPSVSIATVPSAATSFTRWRDIDGCGSGAPDQVVPVGNGTCQLYTSCAGGVEVELCSITGNNNASVGGQFFCPFAPSCYSGHLLYCNEDIADVSATAWAFMSQFTLP